METLLNPNKVIEHIPIWDGIEIADFGSGSGIFTIELAKALKNNGRILAVDVLERPLMFLLENAKRQNVSHLINTKVCNLETKSLGGSFQGSFDVVMIVNALFQIQNKENVIKEAKRILKSNGFLFIVDWDSYKIPMNEKLFPVKKDPLVEMIQKNGFVLKEGLNLSSTHFGLIFIKQ
jgi:ubiquinone/menaquinone biosynthesis C-methylase UbiE